MIMRPWLHCLRADPEHFSELRLSESQSPASSQPEPHPMDPAVGRLRRLANAHIASGTYHHACEVIGRTRRQREPHAVRVKGADLFCNKSEVITAAFASNDCAFDYDR